MVTAAPELRILGARALTSAAVATPERTDALRSVEAQALCYTFPNSAVGLRDVSLQIARGQLVIVTGRIGSGKTTLLRVLLGLLPAQSGQLLWNGRRIDQPDVFLTPPRVAYTPQTPRLFSDTLRDNLLLGAHVSNSELDRAIYQAVLERDIPVLEHGLETRVGPRGVKLSGGQLQRSAAARMFVRHADLMVFDDLSSALDVRTEQTLWQRLRQRQDLTCLAVSTRQVAFEQADWIYVMRDGAVLAEGTREQLLATSDEFRSLYSETGGDANAEL
jgi:ATP-binding cassette subfamily B protein